MAVQGSSSSQSAAAAAAARQAAIEAAREAAERAARAAAEARARAEAAQKAAQAQAEKAQRAQAQAAAQKQQLAQQKAIASRDNLPGHAQLQASKNVAAQEKKVATAQKTAAAEQAKQTKLEAQAKQAADNAAKAEKAAADQARNAAQRANTTANQALDRANKAQSAAAAQQAKVNTLKQRLNGDLPGMAQVQLSKQLQTESAKSNKLTARAATLAAQATQLQQQAVQASNAALSAERTANAGYSAAGKSGVPFAGANSVRDAFDLGSNDAALQKKLLGTNVAVTPAQAAIADAQKVNAAAKTGSVNGSKMLLEQMQQNANPQYRQALLIASQQGLKDIASAAYGDHKPGADLMKGVASNLAQAGELAGPQGAAFMAAQLAPKVGDNKLSYDSTSNGKPVFNDGTLDGALANVAVQGGPSTLFRSIPGQLQAIGKADSANWSVSHHEGGLSGALDSVGHFFSGAASTVFNGIKGTAVGVFNAATHDPLRTLGDLATGPLGALDFANRASNGAIVHTAEDLAKPAATWLNNELFSPLTGPVNDQIGKLQAGQSYGITVDGGVDIKAANVNAQADLSVSKAKDGSYTVSAGASVSAGVLGKLDIPGVDAQAGGQAEFHFDSKADAQRAADTFVRLAASSAAGPVGTLGEGAASALDGDAGFLASHLSAINLKAGAGASASIKSNLGLGSETGLQGLSLDAKVQGAAGVRVEFENGRPKSVVFGQQLHGEVAASGGLAVGPYAVGGKGTVGVSVTSQERVDLPEGLTFSDLTHQGRTIAGTHVGGSVSFDFDGSVAKGQGADFGVVGASSDQGTGREASFTVSGDPAKILTTVGPRLLKGDLEGAAKAAGNDLTFRAATRSYDFQDSQVGVDLEVAHLDVSTNHTQMNELHQKTFGGGEKPTEDEVINEETFTSFLEQNADPTERDSSGKQA